MSSAFEDDLAGARDPKIEQSKLRDALERTAATVADEVVAYAAQFAQHARQVGLPHQPAAHKVKTSYTITSHPPGWLILDKRVVVDLKGALHVIEHVTRKRGRWLLEARPLDMRPAVPGKLLDYHARPDAWIQLAENKWLSIIGSARTEGPDLLGHADDGDYPTRSMRADVSALLAPG